MLLTVSLYVAGVIALGRWLDVRGGKVNAACPNEKPSTVVAAWSWIGLPIVILIGCAS